MMAYAALCVTPFAHNWYRLLDRLVKMPSSASRFSPQALGAVLKRVFLDQLVAAPIFITGMFTTRGLIAGSDLPSIGEKVRNEYLDMFAAGLMVWPTAQCLNMWLIPLQFRVLFNNFVGLGWSVFSSTTVQYNKNQQEEEEKETETRAKAIVLPTIILQKQEEKNTTPRPLVRHQHQTSSFWQNKIKNKLMSKVNASPKTSPRSSPKPSPRASPRTSPRSQRKAVGSSNHIGLMERLRSGLVMEQDPVETEVMFSGLTSSIPNPASPVFMRRRPSFRRDPIV